jgi:hypothetical protein
MVDATVPTMIATLEANAAFFAFIAAATIRPAPTTAVVAVRETR